jgi:LysM repeat protein
MRRWLSGVASAVALALIVVGAPVALATWGRLRALTTLDWSSALTARDDGTVLLAVLTLLGWVVWTILVASVIVEVADTWRRLRGDQRPEPLRVPGLDLPRALIRGLVVALVGLVVAVSATSGIAGASGGGSSPTAPLAGTTTTVAVPTESAKPARTAAPDASPSIAGHLHLVQPGDDLWSLAVTYYGDGTRWRSIADVNADLVSPETDLPAGARIIIPTTGDGAAATTPGGTIIVVRKGDTLWALAQKHLGDPQRWPEIFEANRDVISDPDEIDVGWRLRIPAAATSPAPASTAPSRPATPADTPAAPAGNSGTPTAPDAAPAPTAPAPTASVAPRTRPDPFQHPPAATPTPTATLDPAPREGPTTPTPTPVDSAAPEPTGGSVRPPDRSAGLADPSSLAPAIALVGGVGALLACGVVAQVRRRRDVQLALRPVGRRITHPDPEVARVATALGAVSSPALMHAVDTAMRALGPARLTGRGPIVLAGPEGVTVRDVDGGEQRLTPERLADLAGGAAELAPCPVPTLVALGNDDAGRTVLVDLEAVGLLTVELDHPVPTCVAIGLELACSPWAEGVTVVAAGRVSRALSADLENVVHHPDAETAAAEVMARITAQRTALERMDRTLADLRADPDTRDEWAPQVHLFGSDLSTRTAVRLRDIALGGPPVAVGVVIAGRQAIPTHGVAVESIAVGTPRRAATEPSRGSRIIPSGMGAELDPYGIAFRPQELPSTVADAVAALLAATGTDITTPAPWFAQSDPDAPYLRHSPTTPGPAKEAVAVGPPTPSGVTEFSHPTLMLLGPIELIGAAGAPPPRAERSCIEYCAWLLEHPGATATMMANALVVAEGTRRSNVSRLRTWLGSTPDGDQYLPDAYSGRLYLDACVSSDWHRLQMLIAPGVARVSRDTLVSALTLVRGAPLADAAPGQWHWAEELRTDMSSTIRDIGVVVAEGAIADGDVDLARWATARALTAAPEDELLLCCRIKAEHRAGNRSEVERLVLRLTRHARILGIDLADETVLLIQEVIEGRPRARA